MVKVFTLRLDERKKDFLFFETLLPENSSVIVIGACTGITTIPLAKGKVNRKIFAYEPLASNFKALEEVVDYYGLNNVFLYNIGLGNQAEEREMILPVVNGVRKQGIAYIKDSSIPGFELGNSEKVKIDVLDKRIELLNLSISAIKIVAENFEYNIFLGAKELIFKNKPLIYCELWDNENRKKVLNLIRNYNYSIFYRKGNSLLPYHPDSYAGKNFFFKTNDE